MNLAFWMPKRWKYRIILKSGASFKFSATEVKLEWKTDDLQIVKWDIEGVKGEVPRHIILSEIVAVIRLN